MGCGAGTGVNTGLFVVVISGLAKAPTRLGRFCLCFLGGDGKWIWAVVLGRLSSRRGVVVARNNLLHWRYLGQKKASKPRPAWPGIADERKLRHNIGKVETRINLVLDTGILGEIESKYQAEDRVGVNFYVHAQ